MPGIIGVYSKKGRNIQENEYTNFFSSLKYFDFYKEKKVFAEYFLASWVGMGDSAGVYQNVQGIAIIAGYLIIKGYPVEGREAARYALEIFLKEKNYIKKLEGCFSLVICAGDNLFIINDRQAVSPLYYWETKEFFYFSSELKSFRHINEFKPAINQEAALEFLCLGYPLGNKTLYGDVFQLPPATILNVSANNLKFYKYWDFNFKKKFKASEDNLVENLSNILLRAIDKSNDVSDGSKTIFLSGGLDSRLIAGLLAGKNSSLTTNNFGTKDSLDSSVAHKVASLLHTDNLFTELDFSFIQKYIYQMVFLTESRISEFMPAIVKQYKHKKTKFAYTGFYLDGLVGSYVSFSNILKKSPLKVKNLAELKESLYKTHCRGLTPELSSKLLKIPYGKDKLINSFIKQINFGCCESYIDMAEYFLYTQKVKNYVLHSMLLISRFFQQKFPLIDYELLDFCPKIPTQYKINQNLFTKAFCRLLPKLSKIVWTRTNAPVDASAPRKIMGLLEKYWQFFLIKSIPKITLGRKKFKSKFQYSKRNDWLRKELKNFCEDILFSKRTLTRSFYDEEALRQLYQRYLRGEGSGYGLLAVVILEIWQRIYIDGEKVDLSIIFKKND